MSERHVVVPRNLEGIPTEHGDFNVQGPSVIRCPTWLPDPPGAYLLYFAHHRGASIRLAASDQPTGPWHLVSSDVLNAADAAPVLPVDHPNRHVASPDVQVDEEGRTLRMTFHGHVSPPAGGHLPSWGAYPTYDQHTLVATSVDGRRFLPLLDGPAISPSYHRGFAWDGWWYGLSMPSQLVRSADGLSAFEYGPTLFDDVEIRHSGVLVDGHHLRVWFTRAGDAPERIMECRVDLRGDWTDWTPSEPVEVLRPTEPWEGADLPVEPTTRGPAFQPQNGLRDPFVLDDDGERWLYYAAAGEFALGVVRLPDPS